MGGRDRDRVGRDDWPAAGRRCPGWPCCLPRSSPSAARSPSTMSGSSSIGSPARRLHRPGRRRRHARSAEGADPAPAAGALRRAGMVAVGRFARRLEPAGLAGDGGHLSRRFRPPRAAAVAVAPAVPHERRRPAPSARRSRPGRGDRAHDPRRPCRRVRRDADLCGSARRARARPDGARDPPDGRARAAPPRAFRGLAAPSAGCGRRCCTRYGRSPAMRSAPRRRCWASAPRWPARSRSKRSSTSITAARPTASPMQTPRSGRRSSSFRADEIEHRETALAHGAADAPGYDLLSAAIGTASRLAIRIATWL